MIIDATSSIEVSISKSVINHASESRKVYLDGTKINPVKMSITGHIEVTKTAEIQKLMKDDVWLYVSMTKDLGGSIVTNSNKVGLSRVLENAGNAVEGAVSTVKGWFGDVDGEVGVQILADTKLYYIQDMSLSDTGFINTVEMTLSLVEVVMFEYDIDYKYGVKKATSTSTAKQTVLEGDGAGKNVDPLSVMGKEHPGIAGKTKDLVPSVVEKKVGGSLWV
ncbi:MAG: hypothetical protein ACRC6E_11560 [Fusobacteriaceae bacterium]